MWRTFFVGALAALLPLVAAETIKIDGSEYELSKLRVDSSRVDVTEIPDSSAILFNFSLYHHDGFRRKPVTGLSNADLSFRYSDEDALMDPAESSFYVTMVEGVSQDDRRVPGQARPGTRHSESRTVVVSQQRYVALLLDMSDSIFKNEGVPERMQQSINTLFDSLEAAKLPGLFVGVYAFADMDSVTLVSDYSSDFKQLRASIADEFALDREARVAKYGMATNLYLSVFKTLDLVEETLRRSLARTPLANVFVFTDGNDNIRITNEDAASIRLGRTYQSWVQEGLDITLQPVSLSADSEALTKLNWNGGHIDGSTVAKTRGAFEKITTEIAENTPATYSVVVCETARDGAPRQRRDLLIQGHRLLSYDFNPLGFTRQGAVQCNSAELLNKMVLQPQGSTLSEEDSDKIIDLDGEEWTGVPRWTV